MAIDVEIPKIGESITTVFIARWLKKPGDAVKSGESLLEIDSDKASMEIPSPADGVLTEQLASEGDEVAIGAVVARLGEGSGAAEAPAADEAPAAGAVKAGPAARQAARGKGVDLGGVEGTGKGGRVTRQDVERVADKPPGAPAVPAPSVEKATAPPAPALSAADRTERVPMTPLRRTIARRLVEAQQTAAILTTFNEVDMSAVMALRARYQPQFQARYGIKLGFMSFFAKAAVSALMEFPAVNAEIDGNDLIYKNFYNIGVAVSGPKGLVVPVLRDVDRLSFADVEQGIAELGARARDNKLQLADFEGGTFTISNGGIFGSMLSTPILNPPQVGILGMHNIVKRAVVIEEGGVEQIVVRPMMYLALSYDHRIIDGREAVSFLVRVKQLIEDPERILLEV